MWLYHVVVSPNNADGMANSVDPDQTAPLGLHYLPRNFCPKTLDHYGTFNTKMVKHWLLFVYEYTAGLWTQADPDFKWKLQSAGMDLPWYTLYTIA